MSASLSDPQESGALGIFVPHKLYRWRFRFDEIQRGRTCEGIQDIKEGLFRYAQGSHFQIAKNIDQDKQEGRKHRYYTDKSVEGVESQAPGRVSINARRCSPEVQKNKNRKRASKHRAQSERPAFG